LIALTFHFGYSSGYSTKLEQVEIKACFSPRGGCTAEIVNNIEKAERTILVQAYSFTSVPIAQALVKAHDRGVKVQIILDDSQQSEKYTSATFCSHAGIPTYIDPKHGIAHNKIIIIDGATVITGSFNFSKAAEELNAENLVVIKNANIADQYTKNWDHHFTHAVEYLQK
jgi:phosphatidylserine/phosphatidylglycerophosphate/cardiolipin synthase-like enzyme